MRDVDHFNIFRRARGASMSNDIIIELYSTEWYLIDHCQLKIVFRRGGEGGGVSI